MSKDLLQIIYLSFYSIYGQNLLLQDCIMRKRKEAFFYLSASGGGGAKYKYVTVTMGENNKKKFMYFTLSYWRIEKTFEEIYT